MIIKQTKNFTRHAEYITLQGYEYGKPLFAVDATVSRKQEGFGLKDTTDWTKWTVSFGSCNDNIEYMGKRIKVINKALMLARKLNK